MLLNEKKLRLLQTIAKERTNGSLQILEFTRCTPETCPKFFEMSVEHLHKNHSSS